VATITGTVTDSVGNSPLVGAGITILNDGDFAFVASTLTEPTGKFEIGGLIAGKEYWVEFCHDDFSPAFANVTVPKMVEKKLTRRTAKPDYWQAKAQFLVGGQSDQKSFQKSWEDFEASGVSSEGKTYVARDLKKLGANPDVWDSNMKGHATHLMAYASADPSILSQAERAIWLNKSDPVIGKLDPIIVADIQASKAKWQPVYSKRSSSDPCSIPYR